ncbi:MAG TPA: immunoglobulin domain-containing protein [Candidatus Saccharimonadales bacterium]|nr:immunoglobulin domain-containing protein [Candidatus Saccharimonadales bacterium]
MKSRSQLRLPPSPALGPFLLLLLELAPVSLGAQVVSAHVEPASTNVPLGGSVIFCVEATGLGPFFYQWQKNGLNLSGQTNRCLTLTNLATPDGGSYRAAVFNLGGALESEEGALTIDLSLLPGGDGFTNSTPISVVSNSVKGASFAATREPNEPLHDQLGTSNSVWYAWRAPATGIITFDTRGSTFDTVLAVYVGASLATLQELASDDDTGDFHTSRISWNAQAGVEYHVVIDGVTGETGTYVCSWNLEPTTARLPVFTLKPRGVTVPPGGTATFTAAVVDPDPYYLRFQWFRNDEPIPGATSSNLTILNVQTPQLGQYRLVAINSALRSARTPPVELEIGPDPSVQSKDKLAEVPGNGGAGGGGGGPFLASSIAGGTFSLAAGTVINQRFFSAGTTDRCEPAHCGVPGGASRWFQLTATADGICTLDTLGSDVDTVLAVYLQNFAICTNLYEPLVDCNNDALGTCEQLLAVNGTRERGSRLSFFATAGTVYRAVVDTAGGVRGTNVHFNAHFESGAALPNHAHQIGMATNCLLQLRGSSVTLQVATNLATPGSTYQWRVNGRRIAGAARDKLVLPFLNYSDAGRYSVLVQNGPTPLLLPGATVLVMEPCHLETVAGESNASPFQLLGASPEPIVLEATGSLSTTSSWQVIGPIPPTADPTVWDAGSGPRRFYRALRPPP